MQCLGLEFLRAWMTLLFLPQTSLSWACSMPHNQLPFTDVSWPRHLQHLQAWIAAQLSPSQLHTGASQNLFTGTCTITGYLASATLWNYRKIIHDPPLFCIFLLSKTSTMWTMSPRVAANLWWTLILLDHTQLQQLPMQLLSRSKNTPVKC